MRFEFYSVRPVLLLLVLIITGCTSDPKKYAPDRNYYFTINAPASHDSSSSIVQFLERSIPSHKYAITNASGIHWPYYAVLDLEEKIHPDSLAMPHTVIHRMIPLGTHQPGKDEFLVHIELFERRDTIPNYSVSIFRNTSNRWQLSAATGIHYIHPSEYSTAEQLADLFLKNIIRYSFK